MVVFTRKHLLLCAKISLVLTLNFEDDCIEHLIDQNHLCHWRQSIHAKNATLISSSCVRKIQGKRVSTFEPPVTVLIDN